MTTFSQRLFNQLYDLLDPLPKELVAIVHSYCEISPIRKPTFTRNIPEKWSEFTNLLVICEHPFRALLHNEQCYHNTSYYIFMNEKENRILGCSEDDDDESCCKAIFQRASDHGFYSRENDGVHYYDVDSKKDRHSDRIPYEPWSDRIRNFILNDDRLIVNSNLILLCTDKRGLVDLNQRLLYINDPKLQKDLKKLSRKTRQVGVIIENAVGCEILFIFQNGAALITDNEKKNAFRTADTCKLLDDTITIQDDIQIPLDDKKFIEDGQFFHIISLSRGVESFSIKEKRLVRLGQLYPQWNDWYEHPTIYQNHLIHSKSNHIKIDGPNCEYTFNSYVHDIQNGSDGIFVKTTKQILYLPNGLV